MKKGFTLIELLAVIVILAIIALIATPIVINIIDDAKTSSRNRSAELYMEAVEQSIASSVLKNIKIKDGVHSIMKDGNICIGTYENNTCDGDILKVNVKGEKPTSGTIIIANGKILNYAIEFGELIVKGNGDLFYNPALNHIGVIPEGGTYTTSNGVQYSQNNDFHNLKNGDVYTYGDYKYISTTNGWKVEINTEVTDRNQQKYGTILESINGQLVTDMSYTFANCTSLLYAPDIPVGVENMNYTFSGCTKLNSYYEVFDKNLPHVGDGCSHGLNYLIIPVGVKTMQGTFEGCTALHYAPSIPSSVIDMTKTFSGCTSLEGILEINANPTSYDNCFFGITNKFYLVGNSKKLQDLATTSSSTEVKVGNYITYEKYEEMTSAEKTAYYKSYTSLADFNQWYNAAKATYDAADKCVIG